MKGITTRPSLSRDFVLFSIVIIFVLSLVALSVVYETYEDHAEKTLTLLENEAVRIDRALIVEIKNASYLLESLGRQISQFGSNDSQMIARLLGSFNDDARKDDIFSWVDLNQDVIISSNRGVITKPVDVSDRDYVKKSLAEPWTIQIGRPILGRVSEKWVLPVSMGLTDYNGKHVGVILVSLDINALTKEIRSDIRKSGINFAILSKTLTPLTEVKDDNNPQDNLLPTEALTKIDFGKNPSGVIARSRLFDKGNNFVLYEISSKYPYVILIGYDNTLTAEELSRLLLPRLALVTVVAFFLITLLWMVRHRIIRPVEGLAERLSNIARGEKYQELDGVVPVEIEALATQIKKISQFLQERGRVEEELLIKNTYLRRVKETAQQMNKARAQFLESLATELNKPLENIGEYSGAMKDQHFGPIKNETYLKHAFDIYRHCSELKQMIVDIETVSDMEQGVLILYDKPTNISFTVHRALRHFQDQPQHRHIEVKLRLDDELPKLIIDEDRFNQILVNLFTSAAAQLSPGSAMVLECVTDKNEIGEDEFVFMLKYNLLVQDNPDIDQVRRIQLVSEHENAPLLIRSEGINFALTRMLVSLHQGEIETQISNNHVCRVYMRFPASRIQTKPADDKDDKKKSSSPRKTA